LRAHQLTPAKENQMLTIHRETNNGTVVSRAIGELDAYTVEQLRQALAEVAASPRLVIDLSGVTFVDAAGLGALVGGIRRTRDLGGDVSMACSRPTLIRLLHSIGFDRIVCVAATVGEASEALRHHEHRQGDRPTMFGAA
jgi:anti-sigma B factor antagonist